MYSTVLASIALGVLSLVVVAFIKNSFFWRMTTFMVLMLMVALREFAITVRVRSLIRESLLDGEKLVGYAQGANDMADYCVSSSVLVYLVFVAILIISAKGFRQSDKK